MVPFSPGRPSAAPANGGAEDPTSGTSGVATAVGSEIAHVPAPGDEVGETSTAASPGPADTTASTPPGVPSVAGGGGGGSGSGMKEFCFSDDDDDDEVTEGEELRDKVRDTIDPKGDSSNSARAYGGQAEKEQGNGSRTRSVPGGGADSIAKSAGVGAREEGQERTHLGRRRRQRSKGDDDGSEDLSSGSDNDGEGDIGGGSESAAEHKRRQDHLEALLNPLGLSRGGRHEGDSSDGNCTPPPGGKPGVVDSACATPAPGAWAAPDFGFSSDDDFDIELSSSERSLERSVERSWSRSPEIEKGASK